MLTATDVNVISGPGVSGWEIATAVGTVGAVVIALFVGAIEVFFSNRRHRETIRRLEQDRDEAREAQRIAESRADTEAIWRQARSVAFWSVDQHEAVVNPFGDPLYHVAKTYWTLENFSDSPVFNVIVCFYDPEGLAIPIGTRVPILRPGEAHTEEQPPQAAKHRTQARFRDLRRVEWTHRQDALLPMGLYDSPGE